MPDGTALQALIYAVSQAGGGVVEIPAHTTIVLEQPLSLQPGTWLRGEGHSSVIAAAPGFSWAAMLDTGTGPAGVVRVSDLRIVGGGAQGDPGAGIGSCSSRWRSGSSIQDVVIEQTMRSGVCIGSTQSWGPSVGVRVQRCHFARCGMLAARWDKMGVSVINAIDFLVGMFFHGLRGRGQLRDAPWRRRHVDQRRIDRNVIRSSLGHRRVGNTVLGQPGRPAVHIGVRTIFCSAVLVGVSASVSRRILRQLTESGNSCTGRAPDAKTTRGAWYVDACQAARTAHSTLARRAGFAPP